MVRKSRQTTVPKNEEADNELIEKKVKKGDRITVTGYGRTKSWKNIEGIISHRRKKRVFVVWEGTKFHIEDDMDIKEVRKVDGAKINKK